MAKEGKEKKKGSCLKTILIVIVIIVILGVIASIAGGDDQPKKVGEANTDTQTESSSDESTTEESSTSSDEQTVFTKGEIAEMNDVQVTLVNYEESNGSEYNTPSEGNVFLLVNFEIANNSDSDLAISSMMSFEGYADDYALNYSVNALLEKSDSTQLDGTIAPGADWSNVEIHFTDNVWSNNKFVFEITK